MLLTTSFQVTDMMVANSSNLIVTVKPANQRTLMPRRGSFSRWESFLNLIISSLKRFSKSCKTFNFWFSHRTGSGHGSTSMLSRGSSGLATNSVFSMYFLVKNYCTLGKSMAPHRGRELCSLSLLPVSPLALSMSHWRDLCNLPRRRLRALNLNAYVRTLPGGLAMCWGHWTVKQLTQFLLYFSEKKIYDGLCR